MGFQADLNGLNYERLNREKEEFEEFMIKHEYLTEDYLKKDDYGKYFSETVENLFYGWQLRKIHTKEKENQTG